MPENVGAALTAEQWEAGDYRQSARELDRWAKENAGSTGDDDTTEYVAKLGLTAAGCVVVMSRAHDRVLVPPPARLALAAFALAELPGGFTAADVTALRAAADATRDSTAGAALRTVADRVQALIPQAAV
jgi:phosphoribosylformylglycinamidine (FGAM) synthase-like amidotransferase family enzyme